MSESYSSQEPTFLDYLAIFVKWRKLILINVFVLCVLTAIIVLIIPKWYKSTATILTPQNPFLMILERFEHSRKNGKQKGAKTLDFLLCRAVGSGMTSPFNCALIMY